MTRFILWNLYLLSISFNLYFKQDTLVIIEYDTVYFDTGSSDINLDQYAGLSRLVDIARKANVPKTQIVAHKDLVGSKASNIRLSKGCAKRVKQYFTGQVIGDSIISIDFKGEEVREITKKEFAKRDDDWLMKPEPFFGNQPNNKHCEWFHVCEDKSNHNGQMKFIKK